MLIPRQCSVLLLVDIQERLMPAIANGAQVIDNAGRLLAGAQIMDVPVVVTEQSPKGLGHTVAALDCARATVIEKTAFEAAAHDEFLAAIPAGSTVIAAGCEAHVCLAQTVLGLLARGYAVFLVGDAIGSRTASNLDIATRRMVGHGAELVSTEMVLFEWLRRSDDPAFKAMLDVIR